MTDSGIFSVFIAEDELPARDLLVDYLVTRPELKLAGIARDGDDALKKLEERDFDLLLLDIHLPLCSGLEVLSQLRKPPYVIFTTAYDQYAIRAFELGAVDYLLKPFTLERFNRSIDKFVMTAGKRPDAAMEQRIGSIGFSFRERGRHRLIPYADIVYLTANRKHTVIHTEEGDFEAPEVMKSVEHRLPDTSFTRIHRQHVVNLAYLASIEYDAGGQYIAQLKNQDDCRLPVGRTFVPHLKRLMNIMQ